MLGSHKALAAIGLSALTCACGNGSSSTSPSTVQPTAATNLNTNVTAPALTPKPAVSDPAGEWNLATPAGLPRGGCVSRSDIPGNHLDWSVQAVAGHAHRILMQGIVTRETQTGCSPLAPGGDPSRSLQITGGGWTFLA